MLHKICLRKIIYLLFKNKDYIQIFLIKKKEIFDPIANSCWCIYICYVKNKKLIIKKL